MKSLAVIAAVLSASVASFANPVSFQLTQLRSAPVDGVVRYTITPRADGQLDLYVNPNACGNPGPCTQRAAQHEIVSPKIVEDKRPVDGALLLQLDANLQLQVGSGFNRENHVVINILSKDANGNTITSTMTPEVHVDIVP